MEEAEPPSNLSGIVANVNDAELQLTMAGGCDVFLAVHQCTASTVVTLRIGALEACVPSP